MSRLFSWTLNVVYVLLLVVASPLIVWAAVTKSKYREGFAAKFLGSVPWRDGKQPCVWLHAVSVGEVNLLATTLAEITRRRPDIEVVISTTTKTGFDLAQRKYGNNYTVFYCPLDFSWAVNRAMSRVRPDLLVLAELELWPNLISAAKWHGARVAIINGRLSENSFRGYARLRPLASRVLEQIDLIAAQDTSTAERFNRLRLHPQAKTQADGRILVTGSLKYDGAETDRNNSRTSELRSLAGFTEDQVVWLAGSTQAPEEQMAIDIFKRLHKDHPSLRLVIVPRHPERFDEVASLLQNSGLPWQRRSQPDSEIRNPHSKIMLVDTVGELGAWWGLANIGLVGGSFGDRGGQNMIEPAAYGVATCFGPNTRNFRDIVSALLAAGGAQVVASETELEEFVRRALDDPDYADQLGQRAREFVATQLGATARSFDLLEKLLPTKASQRSAA